MNLPVVHHTIFARAWMPLLACVVAVGLYISAFAPDSRAAEVQQKRFQTPDEAVQALVAAAKADDLVTMRGILGPGSRELISSGDSVADNAGRDKFVASYELKHSLEARTAGTRVLHILSLIHI